MPPGAEILFVHNHPARFVVIDRELLAERWVVREWYQRTRRVDLPALARAVRRADLVFGWFASWHTFWPLTLARIFRRPAVLVMGGYDAANLPEIGYGHQRGGPARWVSRWMARQAAAVITNSEFSRREILQNLRLPADRVHMIYHGVPDSIGALPEAPRDRLALTVGHVNRSNLNRKGHRLFVQAAREAPDVEFVLAGGWQDNAVDELRAMSVSNVTFAGRVDDADLQELYRRAAAYVQASQHEGFGMAVAEAMLGGCIPVVTRRGALPEVVGECGRYIDEESPRGVAAALMQALADGVSLRRAARERILDHFPIGKRREALAGLLESILAPGLPEVPGDGRSSRR
jgi:glycosyltransferase involved in cell wall biosynthesis